MQNLIYYSMMAVKTLSFKKLRLMIQWGVIFCEFINKKLNWP